MVSIWKTHLEAVQILFKGRFEGSTDITFDTRLLQLLSDLGDQIPVAISGLSSHQSVVHYDVVKRLLITLSYALKTLSAETLTLSSTSFALAFLRVTALCSN